MPASSPVKSAPKTASELTLAPARPLPYRFDAKSIKGATGEGTFVVRGVQNKTRPGVEPIKALVHVDGSSMQALPLAYIGAAIVHGVISREEIEYLWTLAPTK